MTSSSVTKGLPDGGDPQRSSDVRYVDLRAADQLPRQGGPGRPGTSVEGLPEATVTSPSARTAWRRGYLALVVVLDVLALLAGGIVAMQVRFGELQQAMDGVSYLAVVAGGTVPWVATIAASRGYAPRFFGSGGEEFRRVSNAGVRFMALVAVLAFGLDLPLARSMVALTLPLAWVFALVLRYAARQGLHRLRAKGIACHRVLVVGDGDEAQTLERRLRSSLASGLRVVGRYSPEVGPVADLGGLRRAIGAAGADTVAVAHSSGLDSAAVRRMAWALEGSGVDLVVEPAFTDVAVPRIHVRPVSGLPLLQLAAPEYDGVRRLLKRTLDVVAAGVLLVVLSPLLGATAVAVRLTSPGPALFRQVRVGRHGRPFTLYKFRSMTTDAEVRRAELLRHNGSDSVLFKMPDDPRVTRVGRRLRRLSIDELPQLVNVLRGEMSLVGPRPPLPSEVEQYQDDVHRRLLVRPGLTGLWQVSGRSGLSWAEAVRLDLYYVENWSGALDAEILWRTVFAVVRGEGAH